VFDDDLSKDDGSMLGEQYALHDDPVLGGHFEPSNPIFQSGEEDEDGIRRTDNQMSYSEFQRLRDRKLKKSIKCECGTTFFIENSEISNICPSCETEHPGEKVSLNDVLESKTENFRG
jgi:hypothetical protein